MKNKIRVLVADASASSRAIIFSMLKKMENVEVVKTAANGRFAVQTCESFLPHLVILEWSLPVLDGPEVFKEILSFRSSTQVVFISENEEHVDEFRKIPSGRGANFALKPRESSTETFVNVLSADLARFIDQAVKKENEEGAGVASPGRLKESRSLEAGLEKVKKPKQVDVVIIGVSTGGPEALLKILPLLPSTLPVPVLVVLHIPELFGKSLSSQLNGKSSLTVKLAKEGDAIRKGFVYLAPGNQHMLISKGIYNSPVLRMNDGPKENSCRPSVDPLLRSAISGYRPERILTVILTGVGSDGLKGVQFLQQLGGGFCITQSKQSCVAYGMPRAIVEAGVSCKVVDLEKIADTIISYSGCNPMTELSDLLTRGDFNKFRNYLESVCGISLREDKMSFAKIRLRALMGAEKIRTFNELIIACQKSRSLLAEVIDKMTTNETLWFRDSHPFRIFKEVVLPALTLKGRTPIRIWSAACSTGQEPYSICMEILKFLLTSKLDKSAFEVVGTDISKKAIEKASQGVYNKVAAGRGLPEADKKKFFKQGKGTTLTIIDDIKEMVQFRQFNLKQSYSSLGEFDVVFLRNVLIYFPESLKRGIIVSVSRVIKPGGYLFLGASEYNSAVDEKFT
ncbi:MAG: chemotaxis protein CheB, partial [Nitrospinota bacterium]